MVDLLLSIVTEIDSTPELKENKVDGGGEDIEMGDTENEISSEKENIKRCLLDTVIDNLGKQEMTNKFAKRLLVLIYSHSEMLST